MNADQKKVVHDALDELLAKLPDDCGLFDVIIKTFERKPPESEMYTRGEYEVSNYGADIINWYAAEIIIDAAGSAFVSGARVGKSTEVTPEDAP